MVPTLISYGLEKRISRHPERFGTGAIEGVAAPESCNNAAAVGGFVPLFALGIPSNPFNAVLIGALMIYGLTPAPVDSEKPGPFLGDCGQHVLGNVMLVFLNLPLIPLWVKVLRIPYTLLSIIILVFCFLGTYSLNNNLYDVIVMFAFGVFGYLIDKYGYEPAPLILAFVLGPLLEVRFRQSMIVSDGTS